MCVEATTEDAFAESLALYQGLKPEMEFDLSEYPKILRQTRAIWGWQFFFVDIKLSDRKYEAIKENCELVIQWYGKIFSDGFDSELKERYQKLLSRR